MTATLDNVGATATWDNIDINFDVDANTLPTQRLKVSVYDDNSIRSDVLIGENDQVSLMRAAADVGTEITLKFNLAADKKKPMKHPGRVLLVLEIREPEIKPEEIIIDKTFTTGCLHITKIAAYGVKPQKKSFAKVTLGDFQARTEDASEMIWDFLDFKPPLTLQTLSTGLLSIEIGYKTLFAEKFSGVAQGNISLAGVKIGEETELRFNLLNQTGEPIGRVVVFAIAKNESPDAAEKPPISAIKTVSLPDDFEDGILYITYAKAFGLKNKEIFGKSDPFIQFNFDSNLGQFSDRTPTYQNAGADVIWEDLKFKIKMSGDDILANKQLDITMFDENTMRKNAIIGQGKASLRRFASRIRNEVEISVDIMDPTKNIATGRVLFRGELREAEPDEDPELPAGFSAGILRVTRICTYDLANLEIMGLQDPYVVVKAVDTYKEKTYTQQDAGANVTWEYLDMAIPVTAEYLRDQSLVFEAWEENTLRDLLIGTGTATLRKVVNIGEEVELKVALLDGKKKSSGRLSVFVKLQHLPPKEVEISPDFKLGLFFIRRITAYGLSNTEWFGKSDPYVTLKISGWEGRTNVLGSKGENVIWDFLDLKCPLTADQLKNEKVEVAVYDKNSLRKDALVGFGSVKVAKAGVVLDQEVELSVELSK
jgi:hypothetical protein